MTALFIKLIALGLTRADCYQKITVVLIWSHSPSFILEGQTFDLINTALDPRGTDFDM
jgi:hypothetical protein